MQKDIKISEKIKEIKINTIYFADDDDEDKDKEKDKDKDKDIDKDKDEDEYNQKDCRVTNTCVDGTDGISKHFIIDFHPRDFVVEIDHNYKKDFTSDFYNDFRNAESLSSHETKDDLIADEQALIRQYNEWNQNQISFEERRALTEYTVSDYLDINRYLRAFEGKLSQVADKGFEKSEIRLLNHKIQLLNSALEKSSLENAMPVYRLVGEEQFDFPAGSLLIKTGNDPTEDIFNHEVLNKIVERFTNLVHHQHGFMSTSISKKILTPDANFNYTKLPVLLIFNLPRGIKAGFLDNSISSFKNKELEMLLRAGYQWRYDSLVPKDVGGRKYLEARLSFVKDLL